MESRISFYLIRLEFVAGQARTLLEREAGLFALIEAAANN
jgi:hypothetical protein